MMLFFFNEDEEIQGIGSIENPRQMKQDESWLKGQPLPNTGRSIGMTENRNNR